MSEVIVKKIYDQLYNLESRVKKDDVYPIHKRLVFDSHDQVDDIYGWISKYISFQEGDKVLDAGCGVGYGSCLLAENHNIKITGISLSEKEIRRAKLFATNSRLNDKVTFKKQSFDVVEKHAFNKIIAIESIKHSLNLSKTLKVLKDALRPGGTLYIVEDFYGEYALSADAKGYQRDWNLDDAYRLDDYYDVLEKENSKYQDLTRYVPVKSKLFTNLKFTFHNIASGLRNDKKMNINKIFRGGYYLDRLYLDGLMKYGLLEYTKNSAS